MKIIKNNKRLLACTLLILGIVHSSLAQSKEPKSVKDYFLLVPEDYIGFSVEEREVLLKSSGITIDIKNGYINYQASDNPEEFEFALFKRTDGSYILAINYDANPDFESDSKLYLLKYENGKWLEVSKETLSTPINKQYIYALPRIGTTVKVTDLNGKKVHDLIWVNNRFEIRK